MTEKHYMPNIKHYLMTEKHYMPKHQALSNDQETLHAQTLSIF